MKNRTLSKLLIATLVLALLTADVPLLPAGRVPEVHAAGPWNALFGLFRVGGALKRRNRVYDEARATAPEINAYYDRLLAETRTTRREMVARAAAGETNPRLVRAYTRLEAALEGERDAAIQLIEAEKNAARQEFERTLTREVVRILIASPGGQRILGELRETVAGAREAAKAVQLAAEEGRPIEALQDALAERAGDIPLVQAAARQLGSAVGHQVDRALGGLLTKLDRAVDDVQMGMGEALDALEEIDGELAAHDKRERVPVTVVEDDSLIAQVVPVDRVNAAADVAATAFTRAAELNDALAADSRDTMRERVRGALLDERLEGIQKAASGEFAGQRYCTAVGRGEYEVAALALGQTPQVPEEPERATYLVCYDLQTRAPIYADVLGTEGEEEQEEEEAEAKPTQTPAEEATVDEIPVGTYVGTTNWEEVIETWDPGTVWDLRANEVVITVAEDGTVSGSFYFKFSEEPGLVECAAGINTQQWHGDLEGTFSGQLAGDRGIIEVDEVWIHITDPACDGNTRRYVTFERRLEIEVEVSGDQMTGTTLAGTQVIGTSLLPSEIEEELGHLIWTFTATRQ